MSTIPGSARGCVVTPPVAGRRLDQATFHERCEQMPAGARAELIGGVVDMPSPARPEHARAMAPVSVWLSYFQEHTPGVDVLKSASTILDVKEALRCPFGIRRCEIAL